MFILFYTKVQGTSYAPPRDLEKPVANGSAKGYDTKATKPAAEPASRPEFLATFWSCCTCCICILLCKFKLGKRGGNRTWKILWPEPQLQRDIMRLMRYLQFQHFLCTGIHRMDSSGKHVWQIIAEDPRYRHLPAPPPPPPPFARPVSCSKGATDLEHRSSVRVLSLVFFDSMLLSWNCCDLACWIGRDRSWCRIHWCQFRYASPAIDCSVGLTALV